MPGRRSPRRRSPSGSGLRRTARANSANSSSGLDARRIDAVATHQIDELAGAAPDIEHAVAPLKGCPRVVGRPFTGRRVSNGRSIVRRSAAPRKPRSILRSGGVRLSLVVDPVGRLVVAFIVRVRRTRIRPDEAAGLAHHGAQRATVAIARADDHVIPRAAQVARRLLACFGPVAPDAARTSCGDDQHLGRRPPLQQRRAASRRRSAGGRRRRSARRTLPSAPRSDRPGSTANTRRSERSSSVNCSGSRSSSM